MMSGFAGASSASVRVEPLDAARRDFAGRAAPTLQEVVMRAMILAAVSYRGWSELKDRTPEQRQATADTLRGWSRKVGMTAYLEPDEARVLGAEVGALSPKECEAAAWRVEGAAVLTWAAQLMYLPGYWELARLPDVMQALEAMPQGIAEAGPLRPERDVVSMMGSAMRLLSFLQRHDTLQKWDVEALRELENGGFERIYHFLDDREEILRAAFERAKAARWLTGMSATYGEVVVPHCDTALI